MRHTRTKTGRIYEYYVCHRRRDTTCPQGRALPIAQVEQRIEDLYRSIELNPGQRDRIELATLHRQQAVNDGDSERSPRRPKDRGKPDQAPRRLLRRRHPRDLFLTHQRRLNTELANLGREKAKPETGSADIQQSLRDALVYCKKPTQPPLTHPQRCESSSTG
ncbi:hypothetical protein G4H71_22215 [Rhodococcus triatomae]|uniref:hypothetical protein n=1 Tax=Rhodococcus triatomae TaxID=300028 RepID=UPI00111336F8|nr:hypothetical protein [Rhodococcus triatomae]QNG18689.1 hypothetical protein G4H72_08160 [Rhodococcus triatomae]QNG25400.1 hypothetical protein G4H71_22215 [Rhodococcus triatomae]